MWPEKMKMTLDDFFSNYSNQSSETDDFVPIALISSGYVLVCIFFDHGKNY